jgi:hypothetical protein
MMNLASSAQQYKQAQALNPLALQAKQMEIEQLGKMNPELYARAQQEAKLAGINTATAEATQAPTIAKAGSAASQAASEAESAKFNLTGAYYRQGASKALQLIGKKDLTYQDIENELESHLKLFGASKEAIDAAKASVPKTKDQTVLQNALRDYSLQAITAEQQMAARFPKATAQTTEAGRTTITQPAAFPGTTPTVTQGVAGGVQGMPSEQGAPQPMGQGVQPQQMGVVGPSAPIKPLYPIRVGQGAGTYTPAVGEEEDRATGVKMRQALTANINNSAQMNDLQISHYHHTKYKNCHHANYMF